MLYSYKMVVDSGFAPNPFHGFLTLATCKPGIRTTKKVDDYIAGFTSKELSPKYKNGKPKLIYIMKVTEKMSFEQYFYDPRFKEKIPTEESQKSRTGDNVYRKVNNCYTQLTSSNHHKSSDLISRDLTCHQVLISNEFFYFGSEPVDIGELDIKVPTGQSRYGSVTKNQKVIDELWKTLEKTYSKNTDLNPPHDFSEGI